MKMQYWFMKNMVRVDCVCIEADLLLQFSRFVGGAVFATFPFVHQPVPKALSSETEPTISERNRIAKHRQISRRCQLVREEFALLGQHGERFF